VKYKGTLNNFRRWKAVLPKQKDEEIRRIIDKINVIEKDIETNNRDSEILRGHSEYLSKLSDLLLDQLDQYRSQIVNLKQTLDVKD
jgi:hypothetical protein